MIFLPLAEMTPNEIFILVILFLQFVWPHIKKRRHPEEEEPTPEISEEEPQQPTTLVEQLKEIALEELGVEKPAPPPPEVDPARAQALQTELKESRQRLKAILGRSDRGVDSLFRNHVLGKVDLRLQGINGAISRYLAGHDPGVLDRLEKESRFMGDLHGAISLLMEERAHPGVRRSLHRGDALFRAWYQPFYGSSTLPITTSVTLPRRAVLVLESIKVHPFVVPTQGDVSPAIWAMLSHTMGRSILMRAPDVARELAWRLRGNPHATAPGHDGKIYRSDLDNLVAAWSEVLFADALGAMYLGPAYLQALMKLSENERTRNRIGIDHHRGSIHEKPPLLVRETFVVRMLEQLGLGESAERVMYQWYRDEAPADALMLPVGQKQFAKVPMSALDGALEPFLTQLKQSSWETLGGKRLVSLKNLVFSGSMNESARAMTPRALRGQDLKTDPRSRMAVAVLAEAEQVAFEASAALVRPLPTPRAPCRLLTT